MNNQQIKDLEQSGAYIERMYHTLAFYESSNYKDFLEDLSSSNNYDEIPCITEEIIDEYYNNNNLQDMFIDHSMYGYVAEIRVPERSDYRFNKDGSFASCSVHTGITFMHFIYSETFEGLISKTIELGNKYKKESKEKAYKDQFLTNTN